MFGIATLLSIFWTAACCSHGGHPQLHHRFSPPAETHTPIIGSYSPPLDYEGPPAESSFIPDFWSQKPYQSPVGSFSHPGQSSHPPVSNHFWKSEPILSQIDSYSPLESSYPPFLDDIWIDKADPQLVKSSALLQTRRGIPSYKIHHLRRTMPVSKQILSVSHHQPLLGGPSFEMWTTEGRPHPADIPKQDYESVKPLLPGSSYPDNPGNNNPPRMIIVDDLIGNYVPETDVGHDKYDVHKNNFPSRYNIPQYEDALMSCTRAEKKLAEHITFDTSSGIDDPKRHYNILLYVITSMAVQLSGSCDRSSILYDQTYYQVVDKLVPEVWQKPVKAMKVVESLYHYIKHELEQFTGVVKSLCMRENRIGHNCDSNVNFVVQSNLGLYEGKARLLLKLGALSKLFLRADAGLTHVVNSYQVINFLMTEKRALKPLVMMATEVVDLVKNKGMNPCSPLDD